MESSIQDSLVEVLVGVTGFVGMVFLSWVSFMRGAGRFNDGMGFRPNVWQFHVLPSGWVEEFEGRHLESHQNNTNAN